MTMWNEVYAPLGLPREPIAPVKPAPRGGPMRLLAIASVAAALGAFVALASFPAPRMAPKRVAPAPAALSAPQPAKPVAMPARPVTPTPAPLNLAPSFVEAKPEPAPAPAADGPLIIDVAEALAKLKHPPAAPR